MKTRTAYTILGTLAIATLVTCAYVAVSDDNTSAVAATTAEVAALECEVATELAQVVIADIDLELPEGWVVNFECGVDDTWVGFADGTTKIITLWPETPLTKVDIVWIYVHEVAHAYDVETMTPAERALWRDSRGISVEPDWWGYGDNVTSPTEEEWAASPAEDFADAFAMCWFGELPSEWYWNHADTVPPTTEDCWMIFGMTGAALVQPLE